MHRNTQPQTLHPDPKTCTVNFQNYDRSLEAFVIWVTHPCPLRPYAALRTLTSCTLHLNRLTLEPSALYIMSPTPLTPNARHTCARSSTSLLLEPSVKVYDSKTSAMYKGISNLRTRTLLSV